jgi:hypothetical protein
MQNFIEKDNAFAPLINHPSHLGWSTTSTARC